MDVAPLYTLNDGEFVSYIIGAPDFVNREFRQLFADALPAITPLIAKSTSACRTRWSGSSCPQTSRERRYM